MNDTNGTGMMSDYLSGDDLMDAMAVLPEYDPSIREKDVGIRMMALSVLNALYIPTGMSAEIYNKLYFALKHSLMKKHGLDVIRQRNANYICASGGHYRGLLGGAVCFTIIGVPGIGKSATIERVTEILSALPDLAENQMMQTVIPIITVQCPFDCSMKGLLLEILRVVDNGLGTNFYQNASHPRTTVDMLIGMVSQVCLNHVGLVIVNEIQNVVHNKQGRNLVGMLTQLINASGISICMVGTPESCVFFEEAMHLARRTIGLQYGPLEYGETFQYCCETLWQYQFVRNRTELSPTLSNWLYEHSNGILAVLITLFHDAQEEAILSGKERLTLEILNQVYKTRLGMLQPHLSLSKVMMRRPKTGAKVVSMTRKDESLREPVISVPLQAQTVFLGNLFEQATAEGGDFLDVLMKNNLAEPVERVES